MANVYASINSTVCKLKVKSFQGEIHLIAFNKYGPTGEIVTPVKAGVSNILPKALFIYNFLQVVEVNEKKNYLQIWSQYIPKLLIRKAVL